MNPILKNLFIMDPASTFFILGFGSLYILSLTVNTTEDHYLQASFWQGVQKTLAEKEQRLRDKSLESHTGVPDENIQ